MHKGFIQHGVILTGENDSQFIGYCPLCNYTKDRFYINKENGLWDCKICSESGNFNQFLEKRVEFYIGNINRKQLARLGKYKNLEKKTLQEWRVGWEGDWYVWPADGNPNRTVIDIRRFKIGNKVIATTGAKLGLVAPKIINNSKTVWICEGDWDGMTLWQTLRKQGIDDDVFATPGAGILPKKCFDMLNGKDVRLVFDNDNAGKKGMQRIHARLNGIASSVLCINWPSEYNDRFDISDLYKKCKFSSEKFMDELILLLEHSKKQKENEYVGEEPTGKGLLPERVNRVFKKWLYISNMEAVEVILGSVLANRLDGDPLWIFIVAPPGGTKSELLMSLVDAPLIYTTTSITPHALVSGAYMGGRDPSLIPKLNGKVLIIKDFTTIMSMNTVARDEIFGILRDAYDGRTEKQFGNGIVRRYISKFGIIAGVTPVVESLHTVNISLGERFLKYRIRHRGESKAVARALDNINFNTLMRQELNETAKNVLDYATPGVPSLSEDVKLKIIALAQWVAKLRGAVSREKYTGFVVYKPMTEIGTRIAKQLCKLAFGISIYKREECISNQTYKTIVSVARDTVPDRVEEVIKQLYRHDGVGRTKEVAEWTRLPESTIRLLLQDLVLLQIIRKDGHYWILDAGILETIDSLGIYRRIRRRNANNL